MSAIEDGRAARDIAAEGHAAPGGASKSLLGTVGHEPPPAEGIVPLAAPPRRVPVPADPALPRLPVLLAADAMAPFLHRSLGPDAPFPDVRIHHVRYIPGRKLIVRYDVGLGGRLYDAVAMIAAGTYLGRRAAKARNIALAQRVDSRSPTPMPLHFERELEALIQWYPLDLALPALVEPPARLLAELEAAGTSLGEIVGDPVTLAYKPRRRAVLRVGKHVVKFYGSNAEFAAALAGLQAGAVLRGVRTAVLEGQLPVKLVTVQTLLPGAPPARPAAVATEVGELLRRLQIGWAPVDVSARLLAASLPALRGDAEYSKLPSDVQAVLTGLFTASPSYQLGVAEASARYVAAILPSLARRLEALLRELEATMPSIDRLVFSHGDFSARQLLVTPAGLAVVDFDAMRLAPAALDPATYAAHLVRGEPGDLDEASEALERLLQGYGGRPPGLSWYLAACILRHARRPFRYFEEDWPERVEGMVAAAEAVLRQMPKDGELAVRRATSMVKPAKD